LGAVLSSTNQARTASSPERFTLAARAELTEQRQIAAISPKVDFEILMFDCSGGGCGFL
jgi:hypothetical protein